MKLFVAGLPSDFDDVDLKEMFELYGVVHSAKVVLDRETGRSKGFGFVDMPDDLEAKGAIETLDGAGIKGKKLAVKEAEEQSKGGGDRGVDGRQRLSHRLVAALARQPPPPHALDHRRGCRARSRRRRGRHRISVRRPRPMMRPAPIIPISGSQGE